MDCSLQVGVVPTQEALQRARAADLDLVSVYFLFGVDKKFSLMRNDLRMYVCSVIANERLSH